MLSYNVERNTFPYKTIFSNIALYLDYISILDNFDANRYKMKKFEKIYC